MNVEIISPQQIKKLSYYLYNQGHQRPCSDRVENLTFPLYRPSFLFYLVCTPCTPMFAKAMYKDAPILILDEPTAALDPIAENQLYLKYSELTDGKLSFFISHRLSSTRFCDRILFVSGGQITEMGTHEELMAKKGAYYKMFQVQSYYYREQGVAVHA